METSSSLQASPAPVGLTRVLVAVDQSAVAPAVIDRAARLPLAQGAKVDIVSVMRWGLGASSPVAYVQLERRLTEALAEAAAQASQTRAQVGGPQPGLETTLLVGTPFVEIIQRARADAAELVVLGRFGDRKFLDALIGSTAERVFRKGSTPVLIVARPAQAPYRRALVAVDGSETCRRALDFAMRILPPDARIDLVHAWQPPGDEAAARTVVAEFLAPYGDRASGWNISLQEGDPRQVVVGAVAERDPDLLVLGTHGRSALTQMFVGSVAESVVRTVRCDVLVARAAEHRFAQP